jgi:hypothetical protein
MDAPNENNALTGLLASGEELTTLTEAVLSYSPGLAFAFSMAFLR